MYRYLSNCKYDTQVMMYPRNSHTAAHTSQGIVLKVIWNCKIEMYILKLMQEQYKHKKFRTDRKSYRRKKPQPPRSRFVYENSTLSA